MNDNNKKISKILEKYKSSFSKNDLLNLESLLSNELESIQENLKDEKSEQSNAFFSPSLEILESNISSTKNKLDKENIKANSNLLEKVFQDFNIDIPVSYTHLRAHET